MRHQKRSTRLGVKTGHRAALLRNLTQGLVEHGRIKTTVTRAKTLAPFVEKVVTRLKDPTVANLRVANSKLANRKVVLEIAQNIAPKFKDRPGGYTRIFKLAKERAGDCAQMALIEWVDESLVEYYQKLSTGTSTKKVKKKTAKKKATKKTSTKTTNSESKKSVPKKVSKKKASSKSDKQS